MTRRHAKDRSDENINHVVPNFFTYTDHRLQYYMDLDDDPVRSDEDILVSLRFARTLSFVNPISRYAEIFPNVLISSSTHIHIASRYFLIFVSETLRLLR